MNQLYSYTYQSQNSPKKGLKLEQSIEKFKTYLEGATALLYSPTKCYVLQLKNGQLQDAFCQVIQSQDLSKCFEAKIFNPECELRWLNVQNGSGQVALLSENRVPTPNNFLEKSLEYQDSIKQQYLLWGEIVPWDRVVSKQKKFQKGWQRLTEARIDKIDIPFNGELKQKKRMYLRTQEYIAQYKYGNMVVIEERLLELSSMTIKT
ncbi:CRISPR-associated protein Csx19 [Spirulina subsalsa]|uniref:type III-D CRISPR-associated protein Csx19 n=1 Tax=Spirulina subsalsa TaxID=54311 RepID=UPI0002FC0627|nr:CRISPR-associated protein Csx19 [Spirulina subsalsa]